MRKNIVNIRPFIIKQGIILVSLFRSGDSGVILGFRFYLQVDLGPGGT